MQSPWNGSVRELRLADIAEHELCDFAALLQDLFVLDPSMKRTIDRQHLLAIQGHQIPIEKREPVWHVCVGGDTEDKAPSFAQVLADRFSYRGFIAPLEQQDIAGIVSLCNSSPSYRPFPVAGGLAVVSLAFLVGNQLQLVNIGEEAPGLHEVIGHSLKHHLALSFLSRPDVPLGVSSLIAVGVDLSPIVAKYGAPGISLTCLTLGCVIELLALVSTSLGLCSVILFGMRDLKLWTTGDRSAVIFPVALRVGKAATRWGPR